MLWGIGLGGIMKSFSFCSIVQTLVIYHKWVDWYDKSCIGWEFTIESGMLLYILPAATARWLLAWEKDVCQHIQNKGH